MNSKPTSQHLKHGDEPSEALKVLAFSYIQTLLERQEVEIRKVLDDKGKPVYPPITIVVFSNTDFEKLTEALENVSSVGNEDQASVGNDEALPTLAEEIEK